MSTDGRVAYEAYMYALFGPSYAEKVDEWHMLTEQLKEAWERAAESVVLREKLRA